MAETLAKNLARRISGGYLPAGMWPSGQMTSRKRSPMERVNDLLAANWYGDNREGYQKASRLTNVVQTLAPPVAAAEMMYDAGGEAGRGNYGAAGITLGMAGLPMPSGVKKKIRAFHGSPHNFDKFSLDKIGTGEGAQAYGHGLYFAEGEGVARSYRDALTQGKNAVADEHAKAMKQLQRIKNISVTPVPGGSFPVVRVNGRVRNGDNVAFAAEKIFEKKGSVTVDDLREYFEATQGSRATGHMYEVEIDADPDQFLDWDRPLSEQPENIKNAMLTPGVENLRQKLATVVAEKDAIGSIRDPITNAIADERKWHSLAKESEQLQNQLNLAITPDLPGQLAYYRANNKRISAPEGSQKLKAAGVPGIKYLDAGSRSKGDGSRNYVVFDDKLISVVRKYGIAGASAVLGYDVLSEVTPAQASTLKALAPPKVPLIDIDKRASQRRKYRGNK